MTASDDFEASRAAGIDEMRSSSGMQGIYVTTDPLEDLLGIEGPVLRYSGEYWSDFHEREMPGTWYLIHEDNTTDLHIRGRDRECAAIYLAQELLG